MCNFIPNYMLKEIATNMRASGKSGGKFLSAMFGDIPNKKPEMSALSGEGKKRTVYDAESRNQRPGKVIREEGSSPSGDKQVDEAWDYSGITHDFFSKIFGRDSIDNKGMHLHSTVHFQKSYPNAFWDGRAMYYGDGDSEIFNPFTILDICAHELGHGITQHTADLNYFSQSGALNESFSDVFGAMVKQWSKNQTADKADWLVGEGIFTKNVNGKAIRSMSHPGTAYDDKLLGRDLQPNNMKDYYSGPDDNQGVHRNSSLINKPFCEFAKNIGGFSWKVPGQVWMEVLTTKLHSKSNFQDMVNATQEVVISRFGTSIEYKALREAWKSVGLLPTHPIFKQMF